MEKINISKIIRDERRSDNCSIDLWLKWAFISLVSQQPDNKKLFPDPNNKEKEDFILDVECKINGQEVKLSDVIKKLHNSFYKTLEKEVEEKFKEGVWKQLDVIYEATDAFLEKLGLSREKLDL